MRLSDFCLLENNNKNQSMENSVNNQTKHNKKVEKKGLRFILYEGADVFLKQLKK